LKEVSYPQTPSEQGVCLVQFLLLATVPYFTPLFSKTFQAARRVTLKKQHHHAGSLDVSFVKSPSDLNANPELNLLI